MKLQFAFLLLIAPYNVIAGPLDGTWIIKGANCGDTPANAEISSTYSGTNMIKFSFAENLGTETIITNNGRCRLTIALQAAYPSNGSFSVVPTGNHMCTSPAADCTGVPCDKPVTGPEDRIQYKLSGNVLYFTSSSDLSCRLQSPPLETPITYRAERE